MNTSLAFVIIFAVMAVDALIIALRIRGYDQGDKSGYQRGFREGHLAADQWWLTRDFEVREAKQKIQNEERWP